MRFLNVFFVQLVALSLLTGIGWVGYTYGQLPLAGYLLKEEFEDTYFQALRPKHMGPCVYRDPDSDEETGLLGYQLRFLTSKTYRIEAVCTSPKKGPLLVKEGRLFGSVEKESGAGILIPVPVPPDLDGAVVISHGDRKTEVGYRKGALAVRTKVHSFQAGVDAPRAFCEGWNYACCDAFTEVGISPLTQEIMDCPGGCFKSCNKRPIIIYFNANPPLDPKTRRLDFRSTEAEVDFGYEIKDYDGAVRETVLDFGDGTRFVSNEGKVTVGHRFTCTQPECSFTVYLSGLDAEGVPLLSSPLQQIVVHLLP